MEEVERDIYVRGGMREHICERDDARKHICGGGMREHICEKDDVRKHICGGGE